MGRLKIQFMADTYSSLTIHFVFSTRNRSPWLGKEIRPRVWAFMGGIARESRMVAIEIGGVADHVHLLLSMPPSLAPSPCHAAHQGRLLALDQRDISHTWGFCMAVRLWCIQCEYISNRYYRELHQGAGETPCHKILSRRIFGISRTPRGAL